eukprot:g48844.t1
MVQRKRTSRYGRRNQPYAERALEVRLSSHHQASLSLSEFNRPLVCRAATEFQLNVMVKKHLIAFSSFGVKLNPKGLKIEPSADSLLIEYCREVADPAFLGRDQMRPRFDFLLLLAMEGRIAPLCPTRAFYLPPKPGEPWQCMKPTAKGGQRAIESALRAGCIPAEVADSTFELLNIQVSILAFLAIEWLEDVYIRPAISSPEFKKQREALAQLKFKSSGCFNCHKVGPAVDLFVCGCDWAAYCGSSASSASPSSASEQAVTDNNPLKPPPISRDKPAATTALVLPVTDSKTVAFKRRERRKRYQQRLREEKEKKDSKADAGSQWFEEGECQICLEDSPGFAVLPCRHLCQLDSLIIIISDIFNVNFQE